jgi:hypothetical protein
MNAETLNVITLLANKLGTTAEYLWGVLLKQAPISGTIDLMIMGAWLIIAVMWSKFVYKKTKPPEATENDRYPDAEWNSEPAFCAWVSAALLWVTVGLTVSDSIGGAVAALVNPEYWALRQILK